MRTALTIVAMLVAGTALAQKPAPKATPKAATPKPALVAPPRLFDFKGVPLGISLTEFRAMPHPDGAKARTICTGEKRQVTKTYSSEPVDVMVFDTVEKSLGVVKCVWLHEGGDSYLDGMTAGLKLAASQYATNDYSFRFLKDPEDGVMRLYQYEGQSNLAAFDDVVEALTGKWGAPKLTEGKVQNKIGNSFDQTTAIWSNPLSTILVQSRFTKIDNMGIIMSHTRLGGVLQHAKDKKKAETPNPI